MLFFDYLENSAENITFQKTFFIRQIKYPYWIINYYKSKNITSRVIFGMRRAIKCHTYSYIKLICGSLYTINNKN